MKYLNIILKSSADPKKVSLTVKGALGLFAGIAVMMTGLGDTDVNAIIDAIAMVVQNGLIFVSSCVTLYGLVRKAYFFIKTKKPGVVDIIEE